MVQQATAADEQMHRLDLLGELSRAMPRKPLGQARECLGEGKVWQRGILAAVPQGEGDLDPTPSRVSASRDRPRKLGRRGE